MVESIVDFVQHRSVSPELGHDGEPVSDTLKDRTTKSKAVAV